MNKIVPGTLSLLAYSYDALGRRATRTIGATYISGSLSGGLSESMGYDPLGRLLSKTNGLGTFAYSYLGQSGQLTQRTVAAGNWQSPAMQLVYDDNAHDRRLLQIRYAASPTALPSELLQDYNYDYDTVGRLTFAEEIAYGNNGSVASDRRWDIGHDNVDRLLTSAPAAGSAAGTPWYEYAYDRADNRGAAFLNGINQTITINTLNEATQVNATAYSYDLNGNLLNDGTRTYQWDAENRLISVTMTGTGITVTYAYDGLGRRIGSTAGGTVYRHLWCGEKVCETRNATTGTLINGTGFEEGTLSNSVASLYFRDQLGSVRELFPRNKGQKPAAFDYGPYGEVLGGTTSAGERYAGMYYDAQVGLNLTWYRAYNPSIGRWLTRDPIGVAGGNNLYGYVGGNPLNAVDPLGLAEWHVTSLLLVDHPTVRRIPFTDWYIPTGRERRANFTMHSQCFVKSYGGQVGEGWTSNEMLVPRINVVDTRTGNFDIPYFLNPKNIVLNDGQDGAPSTANLAGTAHIRFTVAGNTAHGSVALGKATGTFTTTSRGIPDGTYDISGDVDFGLFPDQPDPCACPGSH